MSHSPVHDEPVMDSSEDALAVSSDIQQVLETPVDARPKRMILNMGPQHPSTHGVLRIVIELDGEFIVKAEPDIGFLHTGIEKQAETLSYQQVVPLTDRVDYLANLSNNLCYCLAVEKLLQLEIPARAQWMRVMLTELTRLNSHLVWLGTHALDIGAMTMFLYCMREREDLLRIFEMFSGQRMMTSYFRVGGLALDAPRGWEKAVGNFLKIFPARVDEYEDLLRTNPIWVNRTKGVGFLDVKELIALGITGPMLRAAGIKTDARKDAPYSGYENFDFEVPIETDNDVYARYRVRIREMRESIKIIQQAMDGMPGGPFQAAAPKVVLPEREKMKTQMEALIYHFKIVTEGVRVPAGEVYQVIESPRGELGYYVVSDGTSKPLRMHMRTPSFGNLQGLARLVEGKLIADVIAVLGSMDFVLGDVDR
jgi:NADH-quinone oxidoreductase subunit D